MTNTVKQIFGKARFVRAFSFAFSLLLIACGTPQQRIEQANDRAFESGFQIEVIETSGFPLYSTQKVSSQTDVLNIVIEGDGYAFVEPGIVSNNPTPLNPAGLALALKIPNDVVYVGRPCQYVTSSKCTPYIWSTQRFAPSVLHSFEEALDQLKFKTGAESFRLIGYSGGAYVALRLAASRQDVSQVLTVAGLLDPQAWNAHHGFDALDNTPAQTPVRDDLHYIHICGEDDDVTPCVLTHKFTNLNSAHQMRIIPGADHGDIAEILSSQDLLRFFSKAVNQRYKE